MQQHLTEQQQLNVAIEIAEQELVCLLAVWFCPLIPFIGKNSQLPPSCKAPATVAKNVIIEKPDFGKSILHKCQS